MAETVTVACKIPNGIYLDLRKGEQLIRVKLNGPGMPIPLDPKKPLPRKKIEDAAALTFGVDKEFWEQWLKKHKDYGPVKAGLIFAHEQQESVIDQARERSKVLTGLEAIDPNKPGRGIEKRTEE